MEVQVQEVVGGGGGAASGYGRRWRWKGGISPWKWSNMDGRSGRGEEGKGKGEMSGHE